MGAGIGSQFEKAVPSDKWATAERGPTLRRLFGAYLNADIWAAWRRARPFDEGDGFLTYDEYQQVVSMETFNLLFVWDIFNQQNELLSVKELMIVICIFSSAHLAEKGKLLMSLFDKSKTGTVTGAEVAQMCSAVLAVLCKCCRTKIKEKEIFGILRSELPDLLPAYKDELDRGEYPSAEALFQNCRVIGHTELEWILPSIREAYADLPISGEPPPGAIPPPPPEWASKGDANSSHITPAGTGQKAAKSLGKGEGAPNKLSESQLEHLKWMSGIGDEGKENMAATNQSLNRTGVDKSMPPVRGSMVIHGTDFAVVAKDLPAFKRLFIRSISASLGLPAGCIEVRNISRGNLVIDFTIHASGRGGDTRDPPALMLALAGQLQTAHSALRKGAFAEYAECAELVSGEPGRPSSGPSTPPGESSGMKPVHHDIGVQTDPCEDVVSMRLASANSTMSMRLASADSTMKLSSQDEFEFQRSISASGITTPAASGLIGEAISANLIKASMEGVDPYVRLEEALALLEQTRLRAERAEAAQRMMQQELRQHEQSIAQLQANGRNPAPPPGYPAMNVHAVSPADQRS